MVDKTLELVKTAVLSGKSGSDLQKTINTTTGLVNYDLQAPAKNLYPVYTPVRNALPRVAGNGGTATNWRVVSAIIGSGNVVMPWVPEGQRSARMSYTTANVAATYVTIGEEDELTEEALNAAQGFEDIFGTMNMRLLQKTMQKEEMGLLFGNRSVALGTMGALTLSAVGSGGTLPTATYYVRVVALTGEAYGISGGNVGASSLISTQTITGADGKTYVLNGGTSIYSAEASQAITLGQNLNVSWALKTGAVAYAVFINNATNTEILQAIVTINSYVQSVPLTAATQSYAAFSADYSQNSVLAFDGLYSQLINNYPGNVTSLAQGTLGVGTPLTASGRGSVNEIDNALQLMWNKYLLGPDVILVNSQEQKNITNKSLSNSSGPLLRVEGDATEPFAFVANNVVKYYYNPYAPGSTQKIPVMVHPFVPPGTVLMWTNKLPPLYQSNEVPNVAEVHCRKDYRSTVWPQITRARDVGVYAEEVLAVYAPFALWVINNITNG